MKTKIMELSSVALGCIYWIAICKISGEKEAFDSKVYFTSGLFTFALVNMILGYIEPNKSWRWGLTSTLSQFIPLSIMANFEFGPFGQIGFISLLFFSTPAILANLAGAYFQKKTNK